jgi:hypothetical protein
MSVTGIWTLGNVVSEVRRMKKQTIQYTSPLDALVAVAKRLSQYEDQHQLDSEAFFDKYNRGEYSDDAIFIDWANDYRHFIDLRDDLEKRLKRVA